VTADSMKAILLRAAMFSRLSFDNYQHSVTCSCYLQHQPRVEVSQKSTQ